MDDLFTVNVDFISGHYRDLPRVHRSVAVILAPSSTDATLIASQMAMARGMRVLAARVDWDNF